MTATAATDPAVDLDRLAAFLRDTGLMAGPVTARRIGDGHSLITYLVQDGTHRVVVRRPPLPPLPRGGYDVLREARVLGALHGTQVPVARVLATGVAGTAFTDVPCLVMDYVDGEVVTDATPPALADPLGRRAVAFALVDTLAALHAVDWRAAGLTGFGRPEGSNARLLNRYRAIAADGDTMPSRFRPLAEWLSERVPVESAETIVHGDYRLGNVMLSAAAPARILAVLDWELAHLGDPLLDVGYFLVCHAVSDATLNAVSRLGRATLEPGYPTRAELLDRYTGASRRNLSGLRWYVALNYFKLAVLFDYSRRRGVDPYYQDPAFVDGFLTAAARVTEGRELA